MKDQLPELNAWGVVLVAFFGVCTLASMAMWIWALAKLVRREPLLLSDEEKLASGESLLYDDALDPVLTPPAKPATKRQVLAWRGATVIAIIVLYFLLQMGIGGLYVIATRDAVGRNAKPHAEASLPLVVGLQTLLNLLVIALAPFVIRATSGHTLSDLGLRLSRRITHDVRVGVGSFLLAAPLIYVAFALAQRLWKPHEHPISQAIREQGAASVGALALLSAAVAAPVAEEILFRGVLLGWIVTALHGVGCWFQARSAAQYNRDSHGDETVLVLDYDDLSPSTAPATRRFAPAPAVFWTANLLVSLPFAGLHYEQWPAPVPLFLLSLVLGWLVYRTGRLTSSIVLHATFNSFSTILMLLMTEAAPELVK